MDGSSATLPAGYSQTSLSRADAVMLTAMTNPHPAVAAMTKNTDIFGLMGHNPTSRTAFVSFRGTSDVEEWVADIDAMPDDYRPIGGYGRCTPGFRTSTSSSEPHRRKFGHCDGRLRSDPDHRSQPRCGAGCARGARYLPEHAAEHDRAATDHVCRTPSRIERLRQQVQRRYRKLFSRRELSRHRALPTAHAVRTRRCADQRRQWRAGPGRLAAQPCRLSTGIVRFHRGSAITKRSRHRSARTPQVPGATHPNQALFRRQPP